MSIEFLRPYLPKHLVRVGSKNDGGYVLPTGVLQNVDAVLSFGVYYNWEFEKALLEKAFGIKKMVICDPFTPIRSLRGMLMLRNRFAAVESNAGKNLPGFASKNALIGTKVSLPRKALYLLKKTGLYTSKFVAFKIFNWKNKSKVIFLPLGVSGISDSLMKPFAYFQEMISEYQSVLIKMDIEGDEYSIDYTSVSFANIECLTLEFHDLGVRFKEMKTIIECLEKKGLHVCHVHLNNSSGLIPESELTNAVEITFVKSNHLENRNSKVRSIEYPIRGVDSPCSPHFSDYSLIFSPEPKTNSGKANS